MPGDGIDVNAEELHKFGKAARERGADTTSVADAVHGVHFGPDVLGLINAGNIDDFLADQNEIVTKARAIAAALTQDGDTADANARDFTDTETTQASRFTNREPR
ncbi:hypothetical protein [Actinophytocola sp. NPDC049390]|uniref:hypothetical protein n=1 Tax=Actinophytocola sp. NPDC049390 TaxID=3363894 RepID=UPI003794CCC2